MKNAITKKELINYIGTEDFKELLRNLDNETLRKGNHNLSDYNLQILTGLYWVGEGSMNEENVDVFSTFRYMFDRSKFSNYNAQDLAGYSSLRSSIQNGIKLLKNK